MATARNSPELFKANTEVDQSGCWIWQRSLFRSGYGRSSLGGKYILAHRLSWTFFMGPIPTSVFVLHKCDVRSCVNPDHLFLGTAKDNAADRDAKNRHKTASGEKHWNVILSAVEVAQIRAANGTQKEIAKRFGVSRSCICEILARRTWRHVQEPPL